jgi:outer membrane protein TolC
MKLILFYLNGEEGVLFMKTRRVLERAGVMLRGFCLYLLLVASLLLFLSGTAYPAESLSLNIEDCIELALQNNLSYQIAQSKVEIKEEQVQEAEGAKKINAKFQGGYVRTSDAPDPDKIVAGDYSYLYSSGTGVPLISFNISKILYSGGKLKNLIELAKAEQSIALNELEGDRQELIYKVTEAYYRVLQAEGLKRVSAQALTQIKAHLESSRSLLTEGMIAPIDLNRINSQLSNLEHNLIRAENGYLLTVYNLNSIMGIDLETSLKLENDLAYEPCDISLEEALESARQYRPELEQVSQQKKIMKNMLNIAKSNKGPQIMMNMDSGLAGWKVAIAGEIPIFDGGVNKSKIKQAELSLAQVEQSEKQALQLIEFEVRSLYLKMVEAEKLVKVTEQGIGDSEESFRIAQVKYNEGISTNIEVIDAQSALIEAETNHLNALYDYNTNRAALIKAMGLL